MATAVAARPVRTMTGGKRRIIFPILAGLLALVGFILLDGVREGIAPWSLHVDYDNQPEVSRWHYLAHGATVGVLLAGSMLALVWQPIRKPLLVQMYVLGFLTLALVYGTTDLASIVGFLPVVLAIGAILFAAFPDRRALLRVPRPGASRLLLGLTALAAVGMAPAIVRAFTHLYDSPAFEGAVEPERWGADIIMSFVLIIAGLLVSSKGGGWLALGVIVGIDFFYIGLAALAIPDQPGSWGTIGGILSIAFSGIWLAALLSEANADRRANAIGVEPASRGEVADLH
ncbi:MAG TPA: hypothetical protein VEX37_08650 [Thermomicrobiales bacterium]|nr:hypothetical protein [Thermomicrobiales bacterium]